MQFEWDPEKDRKNQLKQGVSFAEASTVFGDPLALTVDDPDHSEDEKRLLTTGRSDRQRVVIVWVRTTSSSNPSWVAPECRRHSPTIASAAGANPLDAAYRLQRGEDSSSPFEAGQAASSAAVCSVIINGDRELGNGAARESAKHFAG